MRILLAEDNRELSQWIARLLRRDNYVIDCVHRGDEADAALASQDYALVILDLGLPHLDGIEVLKRLRRRGRTTPVIILTANDAVSSRVQGLDSGADDYLIKPFNVEEFEARIRAQLRRGRSTFDPLVRFGTLGYDTQGRAFSVNGTALHLTAREHAVLETLILRAGRPVPKDVLTDSVFGFDDEANPNALEICVHRVRRKLEGSGVAIATLRGLGYVLRIADGA
ncbi:response regulator [Labrys wisconsinensis]|uniref:Two-component system response regulator TctD n=1 Tax=Labrys wisconsinensis TaxID=425677 RepID=A0ABU0JGE3_9HYPH|nr:response regulator [Labrys wisconsinensis]MDQ0472319.1 two-component system response regulator TctD [Labrys wisconsinensis]